MSSSTKRAGGSRMTAPTWETVQTVLGDRLRHGEPLAKRTTLRIGGAARWWAEPRDLDELTGVLAAARAHQVPVVCLGLGSNALCPDEGIEGVVVRLSGDLAGVQLEDTDEDETIAHVGAGAVNAHVVRALLAQGWVGAEFLRLIPGTFGGSIAMNAGTKERWVSDILICATLVVPDERGFFCVRELSASELELGYRHASIPEGALVLGGRVHVTRGDTQEAAARVRFDKERRERTQPYKLASVGSTFANPEGDYAGRLLDAVGLKGFAIGGARVSPLHANFFINTGGATARDFIGLMATARVRVRREFGVELTPEVRFVGFDGWSHMLEMERALEREGDDA